VDVLFFPSPSDFRRWLEAHHDKAQELWVGYYKKDSGKPSITWPESVDEALCFGWIDGVRKSIDETSYKIRFTPRKPGSIWSAVNIKRAGELIELGRLQPAGLDAFHKRKDARSAVYAYEQRETARLEGAYEEQLCANPRAWAFFQAQPPWYQRAASWWVISAKKEETRLKRLATLIEDSAQGRTVAPLTRPIGADKQSKPVE
jgi:uncharacterized protein YdeI (YjbR/CyaY-like superfamily)